MEMVKLRATYTICNCFSATDVGTLMRILHDLWFTLLGDRDARESEVKGHTPEEQLKSCLPPAFTSNMLSTMLNLLRHYRYGY